MRRVLWLLPCLLLSACPPAPPPALTGSGMDMFAPVSIRIHPLSRVVPANSATATAPANGSAVAGASAGSARLEVRLEFADQFGHPTKGVGAVHLACFALHTGPLGLAQRGSAAQEWEFLLDMPEANRQRWDATTRTYLFRVALPEELVGADSAENEEDKCLLRATLRLPNGAVLSDEREIALR